MPWSAGSYTKANNATGGWTGDASLGIGIESGRHDTQDSDFATGINQCLNKDGSNAATGNLNVGGFKVTNVANGTASTDAINLGQLQGPRSVNLTSNYYDTVIQFSNDTVGSALRLNKSRGATVGTNTIVQNGDQIGAIYFSGANGTTYLTAAAITGQVDGAPGAGTDMPGRLQFFTSLDGTATLTERMRINNSGEVIIGATASNGAAYKLQVGDSTGAKFVSVGGGSSAAGDGSAMAFFNGAALSGQIGNYSAIQGGAYDGRFTIKNSGSALVLLGITAAVGTHFMKWNNATGAWTYDTSSARYKDNIVDSSYGLAEVLAMRPVQFTYKAEPDRHDVGFIAEEMAQVVPEVVAKNIDGEPDAISYDRLTSVLCKAIQELEARVAALEGA